MTDSRTAHLREIFRQMRAQARGIDALAHEAIAIGKELRGELPDGEACELSRKVVGETEWILAYIDAMQLAITEDIGATTKLGAML
jgi:hypothetical protein